MDMLQCLKKCVLKINNFFSYWCWNQNIMAWSRKMSVLALLTLLKFYHTTQYKTFFIVRRIKYGWYPILWLTLPLSLLITKNATYVKNTLKKFRKLRGKLKKAKKCITIITWNKILLSLKNFTNVWSLI